MSCFSKVKTTIGAMTSCTWVKISGEVSTAEITVPMVWAVFIAAISLSSPPSNSKGLVISTSEISPLFEATSVANRK